MLDETYFQAEADKLWTAAEQAWSVGDIASALDLEAAAVIAQYGVQDEVA